MRKKQHPADSHAAQQIARAAYFTAFYLGGPGGRIREEFPTLGEARAGAERITREHGKYGRRAAVYAVTPEGFTFLVPAILEPAP